MNKNFKKFFFLNATIGFDPGYTQKPKETKAFFSIVPDVAFDLIEEEHIILCGSDGIPMLGIYQIVEIERMVGPNYSMVYVNLYSDSPDEYERFTETVSEFDADNGWEPSKYTDAHDATELIKERYLTYHAPEIINL